MLPVGLQPAVMARGVRASARRTSLRVSTAVLVLVDPVAELRALVPIAGLDGLGSASVASWRLRVWVAWAVAAVVAKGSRARGAAASARTVALITVC
ncbi:hypothetical protein B1H19_00180 [Streptomyces gilvosporeus]|uniref:Uncharacterized protein n=1 Tax=Streptomyces gilvosporeus TaxID=553510 RepID=A0A1V0TJ39_9ACTN|nr:hypothetical protein B1H19_00180 [Streptomyces gilvosporeus]